MMRNDGGSWENIGGHFPGAPAVIHVIGIEPSHVDSATIYAALDNHRENDFKPYLYVSNDWGKTWRSIASNLPTDRPGSAYVVREDPFNPNLLYCGTEIGVFASLNKGGSWFQLSGNLPTVPVYDLQIHPRDHELIAGTHGRAVQILDVAPLEQMKPNVLAASPYLFEPTVAFIYAQMIQGSEPRAQRPWKGDGGPGGAEIEYRLASATTSPVRVLVVNAAGDTVARLAGTQNAGINHVSWNFAIGTGEFAGRGGRGGGGGGRGGAGPVSLTRPSESQAPPDSTGSPAEAVVAGAGRGGRGGGGGFGGRGSAEAETGDYRVVLDAGAEDGAGASSGESGAGAGFGAVRARRAAELELLRDAELRFAAGCGTRPAAGHGISTRCGLREKARRAKHRAGSTKGAPHMRSRPFRIPYSNSSPSAHSAVRSGSSSASRSASTFPIPHRPVAILMCPQPSHLGHASPPTRHVVIRPHRAGRGGRPAEIHLG